MTRADLPSVASIEVEYAQCHVAAGRVIADTGMWNVYVVSARFCV